MTTNAQKKHSDAAAIWFVAGVLVLLLIVFGGVLSTKNPSPSSHTAPTRPSSTMSYESIRERHRDLGNKPYPTRDELREYLILDTRLSVEEGQMSQQDFERWTGERY